jgi:hypothetical protein
MQNFCAAQKRAKQRKMREVSDSQRKTAENRPNLDAQKQRKIKAQKCTMHIPDCYHIRALQFSP